MEIPQRYYRKYENIQQMVYRQDKNHILNYRSIDYNQISSPRSNHHRRNTDACDDVDDSGNNHKKKLKKKKKKEINTIYRNIKFKSLLKMPGMDNELF